MTDTAGVLSVLQKQSPHPRSSQEPRSFGQYFTSSVTKPEVIISI